MTAQILDGKATAAEIKSELAARVAALKEKGVMPGLGTILVGDDPGSQKYVAGKHRDCAQVGIASIQRELPATATQEEIEAVVRELNDDPACTGYIVQLPLPKGIDENRILELMDPAKDADGLHPMNLGRLVLNEPAPLPCTPNGVLTLLRRHGVEIKGAEVVVVGRGVTIGRPMPLLLTRRSENATVTQCHTGTRDLAAHLKRADIVVAAAGSAHLIRPEDIKPGAAVLDVGVSRDAEGRIKGDVHPDVREVAGWISPNPGGVGPMTRAQLLVNVVEAAERSAGFEQTPGEAEDIEVRDPVSAPDADGVARRHTRRFPLFTRDTARPEGAGRAAAGDALAARQWPIIVVLALVALGLLVTALDQFRAGTIVIGVGLLTGAVLRWLLPGVGMLAVRSRFTDIATYAVLGAVIVLLALMAQPDPWLQIPFLKDTLHFTVSS